MLGSIDKIYKNKHTLAVKVAEYPDLLDIDFYNRGDHLPDCKVGHFGYNFWFRTPTGLNAKRYKSTKTAMRYIKQKVERMGFKFEGIFIIGYKNQRKIY